jgi:hypothetical protein
VTAVERLQTDASWAVMNQRDLVTRLDRIHVLLDRHRRSSAADSAPPPRIVDIDGAYAVGRVGRRFGLSPFELDVLEMCAGAELDSRIADLMATAHGDPIHRNPTFGLALGVLPDADWSALGPASPLRSWRLVELGNGPLTTASLHLDERILHFLTGLNQLDDRLRPFLRELPAVEGSADQDLHAVRAIADDVARNGDVAQIVGSTRRARLTAAAMAGRELGVTPLLLRDEHIPEHAADRRELALLCSREWLLGAALIVVEVGSDRIHSSLAAFADDLRAPLLVAASLPRPDLADRAPVVQLTTPTAGARMASWRRVLAAHGAELNGELPAAVAQFDFEPERIGLVARAALAGGGHGHLRPDAFWDACRVAARPRMDGLAARIEVLAESDQLVLPDAERAVLRTIATHVRNRHRVYEDWGFAARSARGLGFSALFVGDSGTGKTMAAEVLARELRLDLYRIDLAAVVSKYIGETEKNLGRIFESAEGSGAILLFDEADALFGKRSEVRDSHDRYANVEVSYLLQRMESFGGLSVLTTNLKDALDPAFLRRIRFVIRFPFPDAGLREAIWRGVFPSRTPLAALDFTRLAQLDVTGASIRNVALGGAFLAAERGERVGMAHLADAARAEYRKLGRSMTDAEARGWA